MRKVWPFCFCKCFSYVDIDTGQFGLELLFGWRARFIRLRIACVTLEIHFPERVDSE